MRVRSKGVTAARSPRAVALVAVIAVVSAALAIPAAGQSTKEQPAASEVGVSPSEIRIAVVADVDNHVVPGLFAGVPNAVKGFANYVNDSCAAKNRCLAGRKLVVDFYDSQLNANETRNAEIQACQHDFAMVGTSAVFLDNIDEMRNCPDKAGATTGIPDIPYLPTTIPYQCSDQSFPIIAPVIRCATKDQHPQTYQTNAGRAYYFMKKYPGLHGAYIFTGDTTQGHILQFAGFGALRAVGGEGRGIRSDKDSTVTSLDTQSAYTPIIQAMKNQHSNYAQCALSYSCTVYLRKEATLQGLTNQVKVWDCSEQCYFRNFLVSGGTDAVAKHWRVHRTTAWNTVIRAQKQKGTT